jgi:hypothetical protein
MRSQKAVVGGGRLHKERKSIYQRDGEVGKIRRITEWKTAEQ